jgi:hypothetical protein
MRQLPILILAAAMASWGLASIPDKSGAHKPSPAYRRAELAGTADQALSTPIGRTVTSALRAAPLDSCGAAARGHECVGAPLGGRS